MNANIIHSLNTEFDEKISYLVGNPNAQFRNLAENNYLDKVDGDFSRARRNFLQVYKDTYMIGEDGAGILFYGLIKWIHSEKPSYTDIVNCLIQTLLDMENLDIDESRRMELFRELESTFGFQKLEILRTALLFALERRSQNRKGIMAKVQEA